MRIHEFGRADGPVVVLIHGYGTSWRSWRPYIDAWEGRFRLVVPALGGMDPDGQSEFESVEAEADAIASYISSNHGGGAFALIGVSLGATVAMELLSREGLRFEHTILDAGPGSPAGKVFVAMAIAVRRRQNRSLKKEGFARKALRRGYMAPIAADAIETCSRMSERSCERAQRSAFGYRARPSLGEVPGKIAYWYGSKEEGMLKKTIRLLKALRPELELRRFDGLNHGQLWAERSAQFMREAEAFWGAQ